MAYAWFFCPYRRDAAADNPARYIALDEYSVAIKAEGGAWDGTEVLGGWALCKVRASEAMLATLDGVTGFIRISTAYQLDVLLSDLTTEQQDNLKTRVRAMGYTPAEIVAAFPNPLGTYTLGALLNFIASRRTLGRWDAGTSAFVYDGAVQPVRPVENVDRAVP